MKKLCVKSGLVLIVIVLMFKLLVSLGPESTTQNTALESFFHRQAETLAAMGTALAEMR